MKNKNLTEETIQVAVDIIMDILNIIIKEGFKHEVIQVVENRSTIVIAVFHQKDSLRHQRALDNIKNLLDEYKEYRWSENEQLNWREH